MPQREQIPLFRQSELSFWRWSAIPRCRRRLKQNLTKSSMEDFPNITISLPFPTSRHSLKKFIGMLRFTSSVHCFLLTVSRWQPVTPLGMPFFISNVVTSWHPYLVEAFRISRPTMISTTTIIYPPSLLWSPTNGNGHLPQLNIVPLFLKLYAIGRCWMTYETIQNRVNSSPSAFWRAENSTVQLETRWTLHLGSVGGELFLFLSFHQFLSYRLMSSPIW